MNLLDTFPRISRYVLSILRIISLQGILSLGISQSIAADTGSDEPQQYSIAGVVLQRIAAEESSPLFRLTSKTQPISNVRVSAGFGRTLKTSADGSFRFEGLSPGIYRIQASALGFQFEPPFFEVALSDQNIQDLTFVFTFRAPASGQPVACTGYNPEFARWHHLDVPCPPGYAIFSVDDGGGGDHPLGPQCCPLPSPDILVGEHFQAIGECPENSVAVGQKWDARCDGCYAILHCSKVNLLRYRLGPRQSGRYWGKGLAGLENRTLRREELPAAIRHAVGRTRQVEWDVDGCFPSKPGMLFVGKKGRRCKDMYFRELQYSGVSGDPETGTAVQMLPSCKELANIFSPMGTCIP